MASDLTIKYRLRRVVIVHNVHYVHDPGRLVARLERPISCGFLSNLSLEKGLDTFVTTMHAIRSQGMDVKIVLAGPATDSAARQLIVDAKAKFGQALTVLGAVSGETKEAFFRAIDVFFLPSRYRYEAQPMVLIEAMSYGVPVVATNHGYCRELIGNGGVCSDCTDYSDEALSFLRRLASNETFREEMIERARGRYDELKSLTRQQFDGFVDELAPKCSTASIKGV
jgi:glycosyltransferase involved in cell wall biosynthesis